MRRATTVLLTLLLVPGGATAQTRSPVGHDSQWSLAAVGDVIMNRRRRIGVDNCYAAGHTKMKNRSAIVCVDQQVLGTSANRCNGCARKVFVDVLTDRPAQAPLPNDNVANLLTNEKRLDTATAGFDFR